MAVPPCARPHSVETWASLEEGRGMRRQDLAALRPASRRLLESAAVNVHFTRKCNFECSFW
jgi:hypothetical protein